MPAFDRWPRLIGRHAVLLLTAAVMLLPLVWALGSSFKPSTTIFDMSPVPLPASLENYRTVFSAFPLWRMLLNTFVTAAGVTALQVLVAVPAAYALTQLTFRGQRFALGLVAVALLVPVQSLIIPAFLMISHLGWRDTYPGLIVPQLSGCALAVVLLRNHLRALPPNLFHAAALDGATAGETLRFVVLPLLRPALSAVVLLVFINTWNEYLWPTLAAPSPKHTTIQAGLALFLNQEGPEYGPLLAASILATVPVVAVYLVASRRIADAFLHAGPG